MISQYTTPLLQSEISKKLCFVKKQICSFHQEIVFSKLSSNEFKGKLLKQWLPFVCTLTVHFVKAVGADVQLHFPYARNQVVFYSCYFSSWCPLYCPITVGRLQCSCIVRPSAMECLYIDNLVCSHQPPHVTDVWWRCLMTVLPNEELSYHSHHSHPQAFLLSPSDQPLWRHHPLLHYGSFERVADRFLGMKNNCMQIKMKQFDFWKTHFHATYFNCVWTFVGNGKQIVLLKN